MKITRVSTAVIEANYDWTLVRVDTDEGVSGMGEAFCGPGLTAVVHDLAELLPGHDPRDVEPLARRMRLATAHAGAGGGLVHHAITGIESALWDLYARALEVPLYRAMGGAFRDRVRIYADCHAGDALESYSSVLQSRRPAWAPPEDEVDGPEEHWDPREREGVYTPEAYARRARQMAAAGFTALKFDLDLPRLPGEDLYARGISRSQLERQVELATAACDAVPGVDIAFDCHWRYAAPDALRLASALESLPLMWLEDPLPPENVGALARLCQSTSTPIASGENQYLVSGFEALLDAGAVDIVAPDFQKVGGLAEGRRIAERADSRYLPMAPHNISGPVGTMASAHVCAVIPNFLALEWHAASVPFFEELVASGGPVIRAGHVELGAGHGIGIELDLDMCRKYARRDQLFFGEVLEG
ncbi:MAG: mandelate racemase/muconate lactonizing enzyme family protein [Candidatus Dormibacteria bacterium]